MKDFPLVVEEPVFYRDGQKVHLPTAEMRKQILRLAESMRESLVSTEISGLLSKTTAAKPNSTTPARSD